LALLSVTLVLTLLGEGTRAADPMKLDPAQVEFFERQVRPLLADRCFGCHGPEKQRAHLRLDSRAALLTGGDHGPALVPGAPEESRLIKALHGADDLPQMPPKTKEPLTREQVADLTKWIELGAPWPDVISSSRAAGGARIGERARAFWSFRKVQEPALPSV